jgi:heme-binding HmuY-like protein
MAGDWDGSRRHGASRQQASWRGMLAVAVFKIISTEERLLGGMALKTPVTSDSDGCQDATESMINRPPMLPLDAHLRRWIRLALLALPLLGLVAVFFAPWLFPGPPVGNFRVTPPHPIEVGSRLIGPLVYTLDARAAEQWAYFDFSRNSVVDVPHQFSTDWDLAFQRHKILTNGGATNPKGRGALLNLGQVPFDEVREVPLEGYVEDSIASINPEAISTENLGLKAWYYYNFLTHVLRPKPNIYAIRTADGKYAKLRIVSYYCDGGQASGCFTIEYAYQGDGSRQFVLDPASHSELENHPKVVSMARASPARFRQVVGPLSGRGF